jgi:hypothetical protein
MTSFPGLLKQNPSSYFFWSKISEYHDRLKIYLGSINLKESSDHRLLIEQMVNDLILKCDSQKCFLKLFHDINHNQENVIHFLLINEQDQEEDLKKTLIFATSNMDNIEDNLVNYKEQINHYLEHLDLYQYRHIQKQQL